MASLFAKAATAGSKSSLAALFSTSSRPVKQSSQQSKDRIPDDDQVDDEQISEADEAELDAIDDASHASQSSVEDTDAGAADNALAVQDPSVADRQSNSKPLADVKVNGQAQDLAKSESRRKRKRTEDDLEAVYLDRIAREEDKEEQRRLEKRQKHRSDAASQPTTQLDEDADASARTNTQIDDVSEDDEAIPQHESVTNAENPDIEQASRTVFLGNVSNSAITSKSDKKTLMAHLSSFLPGLPTSKHPHRVESFRFRSTAYATSVPKKAAFAKQEVMDATAKSTNAYVVYSTKAASREAARQLNGTVVLDRHLRVDEVAHPAKIDHHRCVFVGNLNFVDDETHMKEAEAKAGEKTGKARNGDVEEGLWRQFGKAGTVESVRVVRDPKTRVSKGFAYVQFTHENGVEAALLFNDKKFPPLLPRKLRVVRAKKFKKSDTKGLQPNSRPTQRNPKASSRDPREQSMNGRAKKLLGRAGAAGGGDRGPGQAFKKPESFVFEGHRASSKQGGGGIKSNRSGKKKGRPTDRSAKRGAAWKTKGEKGGKN